MRTCIFLLLFGLIQTTGHAQSIDSSNYYENYSGGGTVNFLRSSDATPIIIDELIKNGIPYYEIEVGSLIRINDSTRFVATVSFRKDGQKCGFVYEGIHSIPVTRSQRAFLSAPTQRYVEHEYGPGGITYIVIDPLPATMYLLKQECYWFEYGDSGSFPVSKKVAEHILRQDIRAYLKRPIPAAKPF